MARKHKFYLIVSIILMVHSQRAFSQKEIPGSIRFIRIETTLGSMVAKLYNETPLHRDNMLKLIEEGYYDGQLFHRVIDHFMIQGGDPHSVDAEKGQRLGTGGPGYTLPAEFHDHLIHKKGALAAARQGDEVNPDKRSSGSQFYIVEGRVFTPEELELITRRGMAILSPETKEVYTTIGGTPHLDGSYTVFGEVVEGMDVLERISEIATDAYDRPLENVVYSITLLN